MKSSTLKVVLLVGGFGTRLRSILPSAPKPLALVGSRPFLELLIRQLEHQRVRNLILCTGHLADQLEREFGDGGPLGVTIQYSREPQALGTGGAVKFAEPLLRDTPEFLVMNGDSFLEFEVQDLLDLHRAEKAMATMAVVDVKSAGRYGTVEMDESGRIRRFCEKTGRDAPGLINAGVYVFNYEVLKHIPAGMVSLEKEIFPALLDQGVYAAKQHGVFIDIGTPDDYAQAQRLADRLRSAAGLEPCSETSPTSIR